MLSDDSVGVGGKIVEEVGDLLGLLVFSAAFDCSAEMVPMATRAVGSMALA